MILKVILSLIFINYIFCFDSNTEVKTSSGLVRGKTIRILNKTINQFLGIPFSEPPIGKLRFSKPKPIQKPIEGVIDGTVDKNSCMQLKSDQLPGFNEKLNYSEDCLVLNVWSPQKQDASLKPVMFWIYGGGLYIGSIFQEPPFNGSALATYDVVFVAPNYRLGTFGFLYGGTEDAPGNLAFYDQLLALKWVRENIHLFGGDKNQITIFGDSAGSWSTSVLILSPLSRGLFKRAIMESGANYNSKIRSISTTSEALKEAKGLAKHLNCSDDQKWLECLRGIDANSIINAPKLVSYPLEGTEFLPISAQNAFKQHLYNKDIDLLSGVTGDEGSLISYYGFEALRGNFSLKDFKETVSLTNLRFHILNESKIVDFYLKDIDTKNSSALRIAFFDYFGDIMMKCPTYLFAKQFAHNSPHKKTYFYKLTYQSKNVEQVGCLAKYGMGICHGADVEFVFGMPLYYGKESTQLDIKFSLDVMKMWTNFVKTGNPGSKWPELGNKEYSFVKNLNPHFMNPSVTIVDPFKRECDGFWKDYFE